MARLVIFLLPLTLFCVAFHFTRPAGNLTGTWKRSAMTLVEASGKSTDMMQMMEKSMPCTKGITYTFLNDGMMKTNVPDACGTLKKTIESMNATGHWAMSGDKLTVTTTLKDIPPAVYTVSFQGNTMTWVFNYADNLKTPNPTKAKQMTIVYQRV